MESLQKPSWYVPPGVVCGSRMKACGSGRWLRVNAVNVSHFLGGSSTNSYKSHSKHAEEVTDPKFARLAVFPTKVPFSWPAIPIAS